jgi:uncharacterized cupredoxin-like copper-binding protein
MLASRLFSRASFGRRADVGIAVVSAAAIAVGGGGCGSNKKASTSPSSATTTAGTQTVRISADGNGALRFNEKTLAAKPGKVTLVMTNPGSSGLRHGIAVEGNGVDKDGPIVGPGKTSKLTVTLGSGKYEFYCPFDGHKAAGMKGALSVGSTTTKHAGGTSAKHAGGTSGGGAAGGGSGAGY